MAEPKKPAKEQGLSNLSVNSSRRSGTREDGAGNPANPGPQRDTTDSARVPDQQAPAKP